MSDQLPPPTGAPLEPATPTGGTPKIIVWAFILSLAGFLILTALAAVAMVLTNWKRVNATGKGKGLAIAALVISGFWLVIMVFALLSPSNEPADSAATEVAEIIEPTLEPKPVEPEPTPEPTPEPEPVEPEESVGSKLALIDGEFSRSSAATYERRISQAAERCGEPEMATADKVVRATQLLDERGITESNLWVMDSILQAIPPRDAGTLDCAEVIALLVTLRINQ